jgi:CTP:phosphocholine cytidylyltransferase-like protein
MNNNSKEIKLLIKNILKQEPRSRQSDKIKYQKIRTEINTVMNRISDEAIYELNELTEKLSKYYKCED